MTKENWVPLAPRAPWDVLWASGVLRGHPGSQGSLASQASQGCQAVLGSLGRLAGLVRR